VADLTPLTGPAKRRPFLVLDVESKDGDTQDAGFTRPFMVGIYDGKYYPFFNVETPERKAMGVEAPWDEKYWRVGGCVDLAMRHILRKEYKGWHIYAHNAGRFDYLFLLPWLMRVGIKLGFRFQIVPVASAIQVLDVWRVGKPWCRWRFLDSFKLIPTSLDKAAKAFGQKGKLSHDLNMHETDPRWIDYNGSDCSELFGVLQKFHTYVETVLLGEVGITAPSTAMKIFRRNYLGEPVPRSEETHEFVRSGYFGGRVEVFERRAEHLRYFDINSSYPASMLSLMPSGPASEYEGRPTFAFEGFEKLTTEELGKVGFVECDVVVPPMHIPPLPVKDEKTGKLIFPCGKLTGVWEWGELQNAIAEGCTIERWGRNVWYDAAPMFERFVRELYKYRDKSRPGYDEGLAEVVKIMLNATYGKFGMKTLRKKIYCWDDPRLPEDAVPVNGDPDCAVWVAEEISDAPYVMPQIAARVTALSRVRLYKAMKEASCACCWPMRCFCERNEFVAYTDTDSIITTTILATGPELGALKDEIPGHSGKLIGRFIGPKVYVLTSEDNPEFFWEGDYYEKVKAKGLEKRTRSNVELLESGGRVFQNRLEKVGALARAEMKRGPHMYRVPRRILSNKGKRVTENEGVGTVPYELSMW
jgi:hypothetical protein